MKKVDEQAKKKTQQIRSIALFNGPLVFAMGAISLMFAIAESGSGQVADVLKLLAVGLLLILVGSTMFYRAIRKK